MIYKVSYVVQGGDHPGSIRNEQKRPQVGDIVRLNDHTFEIVEVVEIIPQRGEFAYLHVTCRPVGEKSKGSKKRRQKN